jgi:hypothetical protein
VLPTIVAGVLHHTAGENGYSRAQVPGIIRGDFAFHLSRGWNDIGYNFLVDRFGRVWEGRGGGVDRPILGAHTGGFNTDTFAVSVIGNLDTARPGPATIEAIARVMAWKLDLYHRDPLGSVVLTARGARGTTSRYRDGTQGPAAGDPRAPQRRPDGVPRPLPLPLPAGDPAPRGGDHEGGAARAAVDAASGGTPPAARTVSALALAAQSWRLVGPRGLHRPRRGLASGRARARTRFAVGWSGRDGAGWARPGRYELELTSPGRPAVARPCARSVLVVPPDPPPQPAGPMATGAGGYVPIAPFTALDTRGGRRRSARAARRRRRARPRRRSRRAA